MKTAIRIAFVVMLLALPALSQAPKSADGAPPLTASQQIALKGIDDDERNLQTLYQTDESKRTAVAAEFTQQHPGWTIGRDNQPTKIQAPTPPTVPAEPKK